MERGFEARHVEESEPVGIAGGDAGAAGADTQFTHGGKKPPVAGEFAADVRASASDLAYGETKDKDDRDDPAKRPPEYAAMDPGVVDLLARSRDTFFANEKKPFWDLVDTKLGAKHLQSLTQTVRGARKLGLSGSIDKLHDVFDFGSSWGIEFTGGVGVPASGWGKDWPQDAVRKEHNVPHPSKHDWYRQDSGAGNPGMHLGIGPDGVHNLHWDPSNPMERVSDGQVHGSPFLAKMPGLNDVVPAGHAIYGPKGLLQHEADIGKLDKYPRLKALVSSERPASSHTSTEPFFSLTQARDGHVVHARKLAEYELGKVGEMVDKHRGQLVCATIQQRCQEIVDLEKQSRSLALLERDGNEAAFDDLAHKTEVAILHLYDSLCALMHHLHAEVPDYSSKYAGYETTADWKALDGHLYHVQDKVWGLQKERSQRAKSCPAD